MTPRSTTSRSATWLAAAFATALTLGAMPVPAAAQSGASPVVQVTAKGSVEHVVGQLRKMVASKGMMVMGELLFSADPGVGVAVPVRINVFRDAQGKTVVSYVPPSVLLRGFHNGKIDQVAQMLDDNLHSMVRMLGGM
jgi:uncharacterized protein (DUF302 family)